MTDHPNGPAQRLAVFRTLAEWAEELAANNSTPMVCVGQNPPGAHAGWYVCINEDRFSRLELAETLARVAAQLVRDHLSEEVLR